MKFSVISVIFKPKESPPYFIGSQIRGALGYALKKVTCINPSFECNGCFAISNCVYYDFYEKKNITRKYRLGFELGKEYYDFNIFLFEDAAQKLPYIVSAIYVMLTQNGLGKERIKYDDFNLYINGKEAYKEGQFSIPQDFIQTFVPKRVKPNISLEFVSPLRIKKENRFVRDDSIELKDIINSIYQRQMKLTDKKEKSFPYEIKGEIIKKDITYKELTRRSNRQQVNMKLGGIVGSIEITGLTQECSNILQLGEIIGVGKQTVFGLGNISLK